MAFTTAIFTKLTTAQGHYVEILYRIPPKEVKKYGKYGRKSFTSLRKAWLYVGIFTNLKVARPIIVNSTH